MSKGYDFSGWGVSKVMRVTEKKSVDDKRYLLSKSKKEREREKDCGVFFDVIFASLVFVRVSNE